MGGSLWHVMAIFKKKLLYLIKLIAWNNYDLPWQS